MAKILLSFIFCVQSRIFICVHLCSSLVSPFLFEAGEVIRQRSDSILKWSFVGPTLIFLIALNVFPLLYNVILSFTNANLLSDTREFIGGRNYARIFSDPNYARPSARRDCLCFWR